MKLILSLFFILFSFSLLAKELVIISDLDETLRMADVEKKGMAFFKLIGGVKPYPAMGKIFNHIKVQNPEAKFYYLSNSYTIVYNGKRWIKKYNFPQGEVFQRRLFKDKAETFKPAKLKAIVAAHPDAHFMMFGDNIEKDPEFYHDLINEMKMKDFEVYIRDARLTYPHIPGQTVFQHETQIAPKLVTTEVETDIRKLGIEKMVPSFLFRNLKSRMMKDCDVTRTMCRARARLESETIRDAIIQEIGAFSDLDIHQ
jgi:phosphatidate phosphatase APP1